MQDVSNDEMNCTEEHDVPKKRIYIGNLEPGAVPQDLVQFFRLSATDYLEKNCSVAIGRSEKPDEPKSFAYITVPEQIHAEIIKLNGANFRGRKIIIATADDNVKDSSMTTPTEADLLTNSLWLKFSDHVKPFGLPKYLGVTKAARLQFPRDKGLMVTPHKMGIEEIYHISLTEPVNRYEQTLRFEIRGIQHEIPIYHHEKEKKTFGGYGRTPQKNTMLLTFKNAGQPWAKTIKSTQIDSILENDLKLTLDRPTQLQYARGQDVYNGNKYCTIMTPENLNVIPEFIPVVCPVTNKILNFRITYTGQKRYCPRCEDYEIGGCPALKAFYEAKTTKEQMKADNKIKTKIVSDSVIRNADPLGLKAEILSMSGAGLGLIAQTAIDDPDCDAAENIIVMAGTNDVFTEVESPKFAYGYDKGIEKIRGLATNNPDKKVTILTPILDESELSNEEKIRNRYIKAKTKLISDAVENITHLDEQDLPISEDDEIEEGETPYIEMEDNRHPSRIGIKKILGMMKDFNGSGLIWNDEFCSSDAHYRRIERIPKYGCKGCCTYKENGFIVHRDAYDLCNKCNNEYEETKVLPNELLHQIQETVRQESKRKLDDSDGPTDDEEEGAKRSAREIQSSYTATYDANQTTPPSINYDPVLGSPSSMSSPKSDISDSDTETVTGEAGDNRTISENQLTTISDGLQIH